MSKVIHVFRCGTRALYALTADRSGDSLPAQVCGPAGWRFERTVAVELDARSAAYDLAKATFAAIEKHGFYLTHAALETLPISAAPAGASLSLA
jgi:hypothetical protein